MVDTLLLTLLRGTIGIADFMTFVYGLGLGCFISLCFSFGPGFFMLLQTSVQYGFRKALPLVFGINMDDIVIVGLLLTVLHNVDMDAFLHNPWVATIGFVALVAIGIYFFTRKAAQRKMDRMEHSRVNYVSSQSEPGYLIYLRGFFFNFVNPSTWIFWLSFIALASGKLDVTGVRLFPCFAGVLTMTLTLDICKCKAASMLQRFLTARRLNVFNKIVGLILAGFGVYLLVSMLSFQI